MGRRPCARKRARCSPTFARDDFWWVVDGMMVLSDKLHVTYHGGRAEGNAIPGHGRSVPGILSDLNVCLPSSMAFQRRLETGFQPSSFLLRRTRTSCTGEKINGRFRLCQAGLFNSMRADAQHAAGFIPVLQYDAFAGLNICGDAVSGRTVGVAVNQALHVGCA